MPPELQIPLFELISCFSEAIDLVSPEVANHHYQVAYICSCLGEELGLTGERKYNLIMAAMLHDIGALSLNERIDTLHFETADLRHAVTGQFLLNFFTPLRPLAPLIRYHHHPWDNGAGQETPDGGVPDDSHIIHLADRVAVLAHKDREILGQVDTIIGTVKEYSGTKFKPRPVTALCGLASKESFWLGLVSPFIRELTLEKVLPLKTRLSNTDLLSMANLFALIIDFRSYTGVHSSGVAVCAEALARLTGFSEHDCLLMKVAGYFHDLGKLAVKESILEKKGPLTAEEFNYIKAHPYYTHRILSRVEGLKTINSWASLHHERLNGNGYPFHLRGEEIPSGAQIMAVADIFTALTEERPYREGMKPGEAFKVLHRSVHDFNPDLVLLLRENLREVDALRTKAQQGAAEKKYDLFRKISREISSGRPNEL